MGYAVIRVVDDAVCIAFEPERGDILPEQLDSLIDRVHSGTSLSCAGSHLVYLDSYALSRDARDRALNHSQRRVDLRNELLRHADPTLHARKRTHLLDQPQPVHPRLPDLIPVLLDIGPSPRVVSRRIGRLNGMTMYPGQAQQIPQHFLVLVMGVEQGPYDINQLRMMITSQQVKSETMVRATTAPEGAWFQARDVPGLFSPKEYMVALLLSIFLGTLGVDRFYVGHVGLGIAKLLTCGGIGIWAIIDLVLFAMRKVNDSNNLPLR